MTFALVEPHIRGVPGVGAPTLGPLTSASGLPPIALGALFRRLGLWRRTTAPLPQMCQRMRDWFVDHADSMRTSLPTAASINEVLRGADEVDVFVLSILLQCDGAFSLELAARRCILRAAEEAVFKRFTSSLHRKDVFADGPLDFRSFEFEVVTQLVEATGLDAHRFEQTFLGLAADGYSRSVAPDAFQHDRSRAIYFVALGAMAAARTNNAALLDAARRCSARLHEQRAGGAQLLPGRIVESVRQEAGLDLPLS